MLLSHKNTLLSTCIWYSFNYTAHTQTLTHTYTHTYTRTHIHTHTYIHTHIHTHTHTHTQHTHTHTHTLTRTRTHTHSPSHTYSHARVRMHSRLTHPLFIPRTTWNMLEIRGEMNMLQAHSHASEFELGSSSISFILTCFNMHPSSPPSIRCPAFLKCSHTCSVVQPPLARTILYSPRMSSNSVKTRDAHLYALLPSLAVPTALPLALPSSP